MSSNTLLAYHGSPELKERTLEQLRIHRKLDQIVQGTYWDPLPGGKYVGCAVGLPHTQPRRRPELPRISPQGLAPSYQRHRNRRNRRFRLARAWVNPRPIRPGMATPPSVGSPQNGKTNSELLLWLAAD